MKYLGADISRPVADGGTTPHTVVSLNDDGRQSRVDHVATLPAVASAVGSLVGEEPFLLGVNLAIVVPTRAARTRAVENVIRKRFGVRLPAGGRSSQTGGVAGESLLAGMATAGRPCLPYPDRDRRQGSLAESYPELILKCLMWEIEPLAEGRPHADREACFRALTPPAYRRRQLSARTSWTEHAVILEQLLRRVRPVLPTDGVDLFDTLRSADDADSVERVAAIFDATLLALTARRYVEAPETCLFLGDRESGYTIVPADPLIRGLGVSERRPRVDALFPQASLRERLGRTARVRSMDLLDVPGRPHRLEATFSETPAYEFDNLDEMVWWKHCRHLTGPILPTEGLSELSVALGKPDGDDKPVLRLVRSRHRTLSFRFEPPGQWRHRVPTRDGGTYPFTILRAVYETLPAE
ncbi:MAG: DUF429 domain-containing protein [Acidobacteriota bacterium]|nr:DUF429 domain-containing protein [Acidobacteriota bacterium]MDH3784825.1 DUF429 domain-containing protein [Acidobacteriota bacterium]